MPINYLQIQPQMAQYIADAKRRQRELQDKLVTALQLLHSCAENQEDTVERIRNRLDRQSPRLRSGVPTEESADLGFESKRDNTHYQLAASDGSQIVPSAHDEISIGLINTSRVSYTLGSGQQPDVMIQSDFIRDATGRIEMGDLSEDLVSLKRDLQEMLILSEWHTAGSHPIIALGDGPLELFHQPQKDESIVKDFRGYRNSLRKIVRKGLILAGYTDKPRAKLITKMLSLSAEREADLTGLEDTALFNTLLKPGQRSAIFELFSASSEQYEGDIKLFFFYLQVGSMRHPWTVRIEIPEAVASALKKVNLLQQALLAQCNLMGSRPYPYILHRAHEEAVIGFNEKEQLIQRLAAALRQEGVIPPGKSFKQAAKDLKTRTRME